MPEYQSVRLEEGNLAIASGNLLSWSFSQEGIRRSTVHCSLQSSTVTACNQVSWNSLKEEVQQVVVHCILQSNNILANAASIQLPSTDSPEGVRQIQAYFSAKKQPRNDQTSHHESLSFHTLAIMESIFLLIPLCIKFGNANLSLSYTSKPTLLASTSTSGPTEEFKLFPKSQAPESYQLDLRLVMSLTEASLPKMPKRNVSSKPPSSCAPKIVPAPAAEFITKAFRSDEQAAKAVHFDERAPHSVPPAKQAAQAVPLPNRSPRLLRLRSKPPSPEKSRATPSSKIFQGTHAGSLIP